MDERDELLARNRALAEQVKLLVRTEQRLHRMQREMEAQLRRIEELNDLALTASTARDETEILDRALALLLSAFPYDQAVAFLVDEHDVLRVARVRAVEGLLGEAEERAGDRPSAGSAELLPAGPTTAHADALAPVLACLSSLFGGDAGAWLALPLRSSGRATGLLVARKTDPRLSYADVLPSARDAAFLRLVTAHVEHALEATRLRDRLATVLEHLPVALFVLRAGQVLVANAAARRVLEWPDDEALEGRALTSLVPADDRCLYDTLEREVAREGPLRLLGRRLATRSGAVRPVEMTALALRYEGAPATLLLAEDVTERLHARTDQAFTDRLATVGSLAAGVAHEVNNPLTFVLFHLERLAARAPEALRESARAALDGATRIRDIVRDLQTFAQEESPQPQPVDLHAVLEKVLALAAADLRYRARVERDFGATQLVLGTEGRLAQVFLNLVINAAHAMSEGEGHVLRLATRDEGERVVVEVEDTGVGIAPSDLGRIFDPFFTTRGGSGTGLGLSISRSLVESAGGTLEVTSTLGKGTRFLLRLRPARVGALPARVSPAPRPSRGRVLLIDDDPRLLSLFAEALEGTYDIETALGGATAIHRLERERFDAVICDLMMPDVSGVAVHGWLAMHRPELARRVVFLTGGAVTRESQAFVATTEAPVVSKPASTEDLVEAVERVRAAS